MYLKPDPVHRTSLNTQILRPLILTGAILVIVSVFSLGIIYDRYLGRELANRAQSITLQAQTVTSLVEFREDLEWHLMYLQREMEDIESIAIVDSATGTAWVSTSASAAHATLSPGQRRVEAGLYTYALPFAPKLNAIAEPVPPGKLVALITLNASSLTEQVWLDLIWFVVVLIAGIVGIATMTFVSMRVKILKPLHAMTEALEQQDQTVLDQAGERTDEIGDVAQVLKRPLIARKESFDRLQSVLDNVADGILTLDAEGRVTTLNNAAGQIFALPAEKIIGRPLVELFATIEGSARLRLGQFIGQRQELYVRGPVDRIPVELAVNRLAAVNDVVYTAVVRDISTWKETQELLIESKQRAEQAARAKSAFLATMSHEIRTPMNGVLGMSQLLLDMDLAAEEKDTARLIHSSAESLLVLINDILDFSKVEAGRLDFESHSFDLRDSVEETVELLSSQASAKGLEIVTDYSGRAPRVLVGDTGRIRQVLVNLIGNAIKFSESGTIHVRVTDNGSSAQLGRIGLSVLDCGIGIPSDIQAQLFRPFTQADATMSRRFGGTGLGLAICKQIVETMGGEIGLESEPDVGSRFWFTLNLPVGEATATIDPGPGEWKDASFEGVRVLLAEDNAINQQVASRMLTKLQCRIDVAADGQEAVSMWEKLPYDLVFMDCQMPGMDGLTATTRIREEEEKSGRARTPIVALTANAMEHDRHACLAAGMDDYLAKPVKFQLVAEQVARWTGEPATSTAESRANDA